MDSSPDHNFWLFGYGYAGATCWSGRTWSLTGAFTEQESDMETSTALWSVGAALRAP